MIVVVPAKTGGDASWIKAGSAASKSEDMPAKIVSSIPAKPAEKAKIEQIPVASQNPFPKL